MLVVVVGGHGGHRDRDLNRKNKYFGHGHQYRLRLKTSATIIENGHGHGEDHENNSQIQCLFYSVIVPVFSIVQEIGWIYPAAFIRFWASTRMGRMLL